MNPGLAISKNEYDGSLGSHLEWQFISNHPFLIQILQSQRGFETLNSAMVGGRSVDFSFTSPYLHWNVVSKRYENATRIFEVDGPHHLLKEHVYYDSIRDVAAADEDIETYRFVQEEIFQNKISYEEFIQKDAYSIFEKNFSREFKSYLTEYTLLFVPIGMARIQKTLIELFIQRSELLKKEILKIGIVERDLPCAALAIKSLQESFNNINCLLEGNDKLELPEIELSIFNDTEWVLDNRLHCGIKPRNDNYFDKTEFDILLDISLLKRSAIYKEQKYLSENSITIRSSHYFDNNVPRKIYCSKLLRYHDLVERLANGIYIAKNEYEFSINYFIQNIFRKEGFRDGQLPIISRALQQKPVIGLLPTGGGKSLTFQLPVFLQPGLCLVVDPIKSLMADQVRVLRENWIDCCDFINSTIDVHEKRKRIINFRLGETLMFFVSPERFIMKEFRNVIQHIDKSKFALAFSFCVIDEVHCVSEWGHDFRTTYLMLGRNAQTYCTTKSKNDKVCLIGLTATASFDVLADIERELQIKHEDVANAIIMIENTIRPELFFNVIAARKEKKIDVLNHEFLNLGKRLTYYNKSEIIEKSINHHKEEFDSSEKRNIQLDIDLQNVKTDDLSTVIFCPVKGTSINALGEFKNHTGVRYVHSMLESDSKGYYYAAEDENDATEINDFFEGFTTNQISHMVCTKAFGMGIDKSDIRSTYHVVYSSSLESFVQECGRGGRDQKIALANILLDTSKYYIFNATKFISNNFIENSYDRYCVIMNFKDKAFLNEDEFLNFVETIDFSYETRNGNIIKPNDKSLKKIKGEIIKSYFDEKYLEEKHTDKEIHDYFFRKSFKGVDIENRHIESFFNDKEFDDKIPTYGKQECFKSVFSKGSEELFKFYVNGSKKLEIDQRINEIKLALDILFDGHNENIKNIIFKLEKNYIPDFDFFLMEFHDLGIFKYEDINDEAKEKLNKIYYHKRETNDTGRLIYRLHTLGLLNDYTFDYSTKIYECSFIRRASIDEHISIVELFLRRYLSENSAIEKIKELKNKLSFEKDLICEDLMKCLNFITEFAYKEIANKRKRATNEMHDLMLNSVSFKDKFEQNIYLKEQIYFYFNAKYARPNFMIEGEPFSLYDDHKILKANNKDSIELLEKYLGVLKVGTEQNNYKHMIGACKKILKSLPEADEKKEWILRLLKSFSMYAVNNESYRSEANTELENGFKIMFEVYKENFELIQDIFDAFFKKLIDNLVAGNESIIDIDLIKNKLLQDLQQLGIKNLISTYNSYEYGKV
jgi:ATP-dependent DNA helicase RecQ